MSKKIFNNILVTGGAGYVGAVLVPKLLKDGYRVTVLDWFIFGNVLPEHKKLRQIKGDIRDKQAVKKSLEGTEAVIHLACISNDPSYELNPDLGKSVNDDGTKLVIDLAKLSGVKRFIYASSSSVYGVKKAENVTEDLPLEPLTDYSKYKAVCETYLRERISNTFVGLILRPATVCGYSPRMRLDLTVNILTVHALVNRKIRVFGGTQKRPNIHIGDMTDLYLKTLLYDDAQISGKTYNAGYENYTVREIAEMVRTELGDPGIGIVTEPTDDNRSYHINSDKIARELGFVPGHTVREAIADIARAYREGKLPDPFTNPAYVNIKTMKARDMSDVMPYGAHHES